MSDIELRHYREAPPPPPPPPPPPWYRRAGRWALRSAGAVVVAALRAVGWVFDADRPDGPRAQLMDPLRVQQIEERKRRLALDRLRALERTRALAQARLDAQLAARAAQEARSNLDRSVKVAIAGAVASVATAGAFMLLRRREFAKGLRPPEPQSIHPSALFALPAQVYPDLAMDTLYITNSCPACDNVKAFLNSRPGIARQILIRYVDVDGAAKADFILLGFKGYPSGRVNGVPLTGDLTLINALRAKYGG